MKKAFAVLLVLIMVGSVIAGLLVFVFPGRDRDEDPFEGVPLPVIGSHRFVDLSGQDLSEVDLSGVTGPDALTFTFDTATRWPGPERMPSGFSPAALMEETKYLGLGLRELHAAGITGEGVCAAVIDRPILKDHHGLPSGMEYIETRPDDEAAGLTNFHGAAVAGMLAGKDGVAPGARLYYFAVPDDSEPYLRYAEAMDMLLELNAGLPLEDRIRVVAVPYGADMLDQISDVSGAKDWANALVTAQEAGIIVVYPGMSELEYTGAGALPGKDRDNPESYEPWTWISTKAGVVESIKESGAGSWEDARKELIRLLTEDPDLDSLRAEAINTYIYLMESYKEIMSFEEWLKVAAGDLSGSLAVPVDYLTAPNVLGEDGYTYYGSGGLNWATPYIAGLCALGLQVQPEAIGTELLRALMESGTPFATGGKLVNPAGFMQALS